MHKFSFVVLFFIAFLLPSVSCKENLGNNSDSSNKANTAAEIPGYKGNMNGVVEGNKKLALSDGDNLEDSIHKTSLDPIFFRFLDSKSNESRIQVPDQAMTELNFYLRSKLNFFLIPYQNPSDNTEKIVRDQKLMKDANTTINQLVLVEINTPEGKRKISQVEADSLIEFVGIVADDLQQSLKK